QLPRKLPRRRRQPRAPQLPRRPTLRRLAENGPDRCRGPVSRWSLALCSSSRLTSSEGGGGCSSAPTNPHHPARCHHPPDLNDGSHDVSLGSSALPRFTEPQSVPTPACRGF